MNKALIDKKIVLEKIPGKGGWTYAKIPGVKNENGKPFGFLKVKGSIDGFAIKQYNLMPMGKGVLFLPVKAEIRKKIGKQEGDTVHVILFRDTDPLEIPQEFYLCLLDEPQALHFFERLTTSEQKFYIDWIYAAKKEVTRIDRLTKSVVRLAKELKFYAKEE